jgi:hypothetical protein
MSTTAKTGIALVIVLVLVVLGWVMFSDKPAPEPVQNTAIQTIAPTPTPKLPNTANTGMADMNDATNDGLKTDLDAVGKQMSDLNSDTLNVDQGIKEAI